MKESKINAFLTGSPSVPRTFIGAVNIHAQVFTLTFNLKPLRKNIYVSFLLCIEDN